MPTLADIQAATPRCPRTGVKRDNRVYPNERCHITLRRTVQSDEVGRPLFTAWRCPRHGVVYGSELVPAYLRMAA